MNIPSIEKIREAIATLEVLLDDYKSKAKESGQNLGTQIGAENEYTISSLLAGINDRILDIKSLLRTNRIFQNITSVDERSSIASQLNNIKSHLSGFNWQAAINSYDALNILLRSLGVLDSNEKLVDYLAALSELSEMRERIDELSQDATSELSKIRKIIEQVTSNKENYEAKHNDMVSKLQELDDGIVEVKQQYNELKGLVTNANTWSGQIQQKLNTATSHEKIIQTFSENVSKRENQLSDQQIKTDEYNEALKTFALEHKEKLNEAQELIDASREALKLTTAEGLSSAFSAQYEISNNPHQKRNWLWGATIFLLLTIGLGAWVVAGWGIEDPENIRSILGRVALLPLALLGALFCGNQYVKLTNIAEDYAYKSVLAKSLVAFAEEIKESDTTKYGEYITSVLGQIHQDPLRKRGKEEKDFSSSLSSVQRAFKWFRDITG